MEVALVYPHQLFLSHPAAQKGRCIYLIEDPLFFGNDPHWPCSMHVQKLMLHRASMKAYAAELEERGHEVKFVECPQGSHIDSASLLEHALARSAKELHLCDPADDVLMRRVTRFAGARDIKLVVYPSPGFLSPDDFLEEQIARRKKPFMANFYKAQRKRMAVLLDDEGEAVGGKWSFDEDNRKKLPKGHLPPPEPMQPPDHYVKEAKAWVEKRFPNNPGRSERFRWPVTRKAALEWLERFFSERFHDFGIYEDAISTEHATINHSAITPMLNIGLLEARDVVDKALAMKDKVPLNSLEGFIRQVIGWREFMRGIYRHKGVTIRAGNYWNFTRKMPKAFYDGSTGIPPIDRVIKQVLADGYCHHIERLMVLGNFMLLCRIHPDDVYRWFMELFVDAYDWVMVPNVYGMSQFADGGTFTTKPYLSGSNYVLKMSDEKKGGWCAIWDGLFWSFIGDHSDFFLSNPRLSMMARNWSKMSDDKKAAHRNAAEGFLKRLK